MGHYRYIRDWAPPDRPQYLMDFRDEDGASMTPALLARKVLEALQTVEPDRQKLNGRKFKITVRLLEAG